jgi:hypothetical protein
VPERPATPPAPAGPYEERLRPPAWVWLAGWFLVLSLGVAVLAALGPAWAAAAVLLPGSAVTAGLLRWTAVVAVRDGELRAGPAHIPVRALGPAQALDAEQARRVRGPESDPAGFHLIRGWVSGGVLARVDDPGDPTPYWFVASRHPGRLAAAIEAARSDEVRPRSRGR